MCRREGGESRGKWSRVREMMSAITRTCGVLGLAGRDRTRECCQGESRKNPSKNSRISSRSIFAGALGSRGDPRLFQSRNCEKILLLRLEISERPFRSFLVVTKKVFSNEYWWRQANLKVPLSSEFLDAESKGSSCKRDKIDNKAGPAAKQCCYKKKGPYIPIPPRRKK